MENTTQYIWGVTHSWDDNDTRDRFFYPCESKEVAIKFLARLKKSALTDLTDWTDGKFNVEDDTETRFCGASDDYFMYNELFVEQKELITENDIKPLTTRKYGREWRYTNADYSFVDNDVNWWFTAEFEEGELFTNNVLGIMLFIEKDGTKLECDI